MQAKVKSSREELITREGALKREKSEIVDTEAKLRSVEGHVFCFTSTKVRVHTLVQ